MPHGRTIFYPFILATISMVLSFRTLASCDLISTKWSIDCSSTVSAQCVFKSNLNLGLLAKETFVNINVDDEARPNLDELTKVCRWYTEEEREWLLGKYWDMTIISQSIIVGIAFLGTFCIGLTSCYAFKGMYKFKLLSMIFVLCAIANAFPLALQLTSDLCTLQRGICDPTEAFCVSSCFWGSGSWQTLAASFMWMSTAITTWLVPSTHTNLRYSDKYGEDVDEESICRTNSHGSKSVEDDCESEFSDFER